MKKTLLCFTFLFCLSFLSFAQYGNDLIFMNGAYSGMNMVFEMDGDRTNLKTNNVGFNNVIFLEDNKCFYLNQTFSIPLDLTVIINDETQTMSIDDFGPFNVGIDVIGGFGVNLKWGIMGLLLGGGINLNCFFLSPDIFNDEIDPFGSGVLDSIQCYSIGPGAGATLYIEIGSRLIGITSTIRYNLLGFDVSQIMEMGPVFKRNVCVDLCVGVGRALK